MKHRIVLIFILLAIAPFLPAEKNRGSQFAFIAIPAMEIPLGETADYFTLGGSLGLLGEYTFASRLPLFVQAGLGYNLQPIRAEQAVSLLSGVAGAGLNLELAPRLAIRGQVSGGYYYGFIHGSEASGGGGNPFLSAGLDLSFLLSPSINLGLGAGYKNYLGLYQGIGVSLGTSWFLRGVPERRARLERALPAKPQLLQGPRSPEPGQGIGVGKIEFTQIFPVFHKYYDDHPIGTMAIRNQDKEPVTNLVVTLWIKQYMDSPKECFRSESLAGGESRSVDLFALFTDEVLEITEATKVASEITLEYRLGEAHYRDVKTETVRLYDRNALTWEDDRRVAAFVTAKDPMILTFSKIVAGLLRDSGSAAINANLRTAIGLHEALSLYGVRYVVDPKTPYAERSADHRQIDFLQFPRQTLEYMAGDCDDLSILYGALLESVGIETAFITVPGHIYLAFCLDLEPEQARKEFSDPGELIVAQGKVWLPVEVTEREGGFLKAWQIGAREWRENAARDQARLYPTHQAWETYEPVGLPGANTEVSLPSPQRIQSQYTQELTRFVDREVSPQAARLREQIGARSGDLKLQNNLGVLYARFGLLDKAEVEFRKVLKQKDYVPTLLNMGNIYFLKSDFRAALGYYERASRLEPANSVALLSLAKLNHELENYTLASENFDRLKLADPKLAERFSYLGARGESEARAEEADAGKGVMVWAQD